MTEVNGEVSGFALMNGSSITGTIIFIALVLYTTISSSNGGSNESSSGDIPLTGSGDEKMIHAAPDDEKDGVSYNYSLFHISMAFGSLYIMCVLTNWSPAGDSANLWPAVWIKVVTSWLAFLLYIWTLIAPIVLEDRIF